MNLTKLNNEIAQSFEAFKEAKLDERCREILHDLGIPLIMPIQHQLNLKQVSVPFKSRNSPIIE